MDTPAPLRIALCDDTPALLAQEEALLRGALADLPHELVCCREGGALLAAAEERPFDVAVLDIQMPDRDGIALGRALLERCPDCRIVFLTAYIAYCQDVYDVEHCAFVLKDGMESRLPGAVRRACAKRGRKNDPPCLIVGDPGRAVQIPQGDILYLEHQGRETWVWTLGGTLAAEEKLEALLARLDPVAFCQTHKSYAVHWPFVERYDKTELRMAGGAKVPISRSYQTAVRRSFLAYADTLQPVPREDLP